MIECRAFRSEIERLVTAPRSAWPAEAMAHVTGCKGCAQALAVASVARGLVRAASTGAEPGPAFARRVMVAVGAEHPRTGGVDLWWPARLLLPAFGSVAAVLLVASLYGGGDLPVLGTWMAIASATSASETLVFEAGPSDPDVVLAAVLENGG
jgi:hypothetical protein